MDAKTILNTLKEASPFDLFLVSFIALPFVFEAWIEVLDTLKFGLCGKYWSSGIILLAYVVGIVSMLIGSNKQKQREAAKDQIIGYLTRHNYEMMALETIRKNINSGYSDELLESLPIHFPSDIRRAKLKGGKKGIARIIESTTVESEA